MKESKVTKVLYTPMRNGKPALTEELKGTESVKVEEILENRLICSELRNHTGRFWMCELTRNINSDRKTNVDNRRLVRSLIANTNVVVVPARIAIAYLVKYMSISSLLYTTEIENIIEEFSNAED